MKFKIGKLITCTTNGGKKNKDVAKGAIHDKRLYSLANEVVNLIDANFDDHWKEGDDSLYDEYGYDEDGYDRDGYDENGYDRGGFDEWGFDEDGYNDDGYDKNGYDRDGYDEDGHYRENKIKKAREIRESSQLFRRILTGKRI